MKFKSYLALIIYIVCYPAIRIIIKNSHRAYVVMLHDNKILLTQNLLGRHKKWRLPGGGIKKGEDVANAALRELREELGVIFNPDHLWHLGSAYKTDSGYYYHLFKIDLATAPILEPNPKEIYQTKYFNRQEILNLTLDETVEKAISHIGWS